MRPSLQSDLPFDRLKNVLIKVAFADHIRFINMFFKQYIVTLHAIVLRQMQTAYRDNSDSQILAKSCRKFLFDKNDNAQDELVVRIPLFGYFS